VVDPVMVASSGDPLLKKSAIAAYENFLFPLATLVTPNLDELRILSRRPCRDLGEMREAGAELVSRHHCAFLLKGGHLKTKLAIDTLVTHDNTRDFSAGFRKNIDAHGTGCTLSAAIATGLAQGLSLENAVARAKNYITRAIEKSYRWPETSALNHSA
jgi:hydroxymethylpyrimidine/phosphomethylpyrimidine kinase